MEWMKVGMDVATGGVAGVLDQVLQNQDDKRAAALPTGETLGVMKQYGTYLNYGVPILGIVASAMGWLKGDWASRAITAGSVLAGRKVTWQFTKRKETPGYGAFARVGNTAEIEAARREARARALAAAGGHRGQISEFEIPIIAGGQILR